MALIKCKECSKDISDAAAVCPECGCPVIDEKQAKKAKTRKILSIIGAVIAILCIVGVPLINHFIDKRIQENKTDAINALKQVKENFGMENKIAESIAPSKRNDVKLRENVMILAQNMALKEVKITGSKVKIDQQVALTLSWTGMVFDDYEPVEKTFNAVILFEKQNDKWFIVDCTDVSGVL